MCGVWGAATGAPGWRGQQMVAARGSAERGEVPWYAWVACMVDKHAWRLRWHPA